MLEDTTGNQPHVKQRMDICMNYLPEKGYKRIIVICFYALLAAAFLILFFYFLWKPIMPFLLAWLMAMLLHPLICRCVKKTGISRKFWSVLFVILLLGLLTGIVYFLCSSLFSELDSLAGWLSDNMGNISEWFDGITEQIQSFLTNLPAYRDGREEGLLWNLISETDDILLDVLKNATTTVSTAVSGWVARAAGALPNFFLFIVIMLIAAVYFCSDYDKIMAFVVRQLPKRMARGLHVVRTELVLTGLKYLRAYFFIIVITFSELYLGFLILDVEYAVGLALLIAVVDILPVLGTGTILIPWTLICFLKKDFYLGIGLAIMYLVIAVIRQIIEPRIVGRSIGLHPLVTLASMYVGLKLGGLLWLILLPVAVNVLKNLNEEGKIRLWKTEAAEKAADGVEPPSAAAKK